MLKLIIKTEEMYLQNRPFIIYSVYLFIYGVICNLLLLFFLLLFPFYFILIFFFNSNLYFTLFRFMFYFLCDSARLLLHMFSLLSLVYILIFGNTFFCWLTVRHQSVFFFLFSLRKGSGLLSFKIWSVDFILFCNINYYIIFQLVRP